jgi:ligand-binding SRPBCC domain-containing protein
MPRGADGYLEQRRTRYEMRARTTLPAPVVDVCSFFSRAENLGLMTPARMGFTITEAPADLHTGAVIRYRVRLGVVPVTWETRIDEWQPGERFVDVQVKGPYHCWWHEHRFTADGPDRTIMEDRVLYTPPFGVLGRIANRVVIEAALRDIFTFRADAIRLRFGAPAVVPTVAH